MYSIEFAHIYLDEYIAMEHFLGKEKVLDIIKTRGYRSEDFTLLNLVDDYNAIQNNLSLKEWNEFLNSDLPKSIDILYESDMIFYAPLALKFLKGKDARSYRRYIAKYNKYPCSLLAITSYLIRLGKIETKYNIQTASHLINVLSDRFEIVENICKKILSRSKLKGIEKNIETIYIKGTYGLYRPNA